LTLFPQPKPVIPVPKGNRGVAFESLLQFQFGRYKAAGWLIIRNHVPSIYQGKGLARVIGKAPPDWILMKNGVSFLIDAKDCQDTSYGFSEIPEHQADWFSAAIKAGCRAGLVIRFSSGIVYWADWAAIGPLYADWQRGGKVAGINQGNLAALTREVRGFDFLGAALD
jgi:penicillin-binding protein-related factor A (putative recombinase)